MKVMKKKSKWRSFAEARKFVRSLKLKGRKEWEQYCRGELEAYPPKPKDIPKTPYEVYKGKGWTGTRDWLGSKWRPFAEARKFVRSLKLKRHKEWEQYCKGELEGCPPKPKDIPANPL